MKKVLHYTVASMILFMLIGNIGCNEEKCGCEEGETKFSLTEEPGFIHYNEETKYAEFIPKTYGKFTICDPVAVWDMITKFESGEEVLVWGPVADDCMAQMNPQYYSGYYVLHLEKMELNEFGH